MPPIRFRLVVAALAAALAAPATAQEAPAATGDAPAATEAPAAPAETGDTPPAAPDVAAPAAEAPAEGAEAPDGAKAGDPAKPEVMEIVKDTFGDWQVRCAPDGTDCFMYQLGLDAERNPVAEVSILRLPEAAEADAGVTIVSPLGTLLPNGVVVQIDDGDRRQYPFAWCSQVGCFSRFGLDEPAVAAMKRGKAGKIMLVSVGHPEQPVVLDLSLSGFTAAYDSLEVPQAPAAAPAPALPTLAPPARN